MTHPRFRRHRSGDGRQPAFTGDFPPADRDITETFAVADYDSDTYEWGATSCEGSHVDPGAPETHPLAKLRSQPRYEPPATQAPARYTATTGPLPVAVRPEVSIGDALTHDEQWGPKLVPLPCGYCGAAPDIPGGILERTRIIGYVNHLAWNAGWKYDVDIIWTCPACQQDAAWKARQGQLEHRAVPCDRHSLDAWEDVDPDECRCTCPGARLAVDVMLASEDYLGSGRGRHKAGAR